MQACRFRGSASSADLSIGFVEIARALTGKIQIVDVGTPTRKDKRRLQSLGLDLTEHGDGNSVEVVLHGGGRREKLRDAGFTYDVRVADLEARAKADEPRDAKYAASNPKTQLPSGSNQYRHLADYDLEMKQLAMRYPGLAKELTLNHPTIEGRDVNGIEITQNPQAQDGKPIFLQLGVHHAREWPSSEHAIEFAYDLLTNYGSSARTTELVNTTRTIVVPIVNPDGFNISREAPHAGLSASFGLFDYEMKRKNCRISANTPAQYKTGTCSDNLAGRLRGTDPNRNYGGLWGGGGASTIWSERHLPRRRPVLRARDPEHPRAAVHPLDHEPDHQPHVLEPRAAPAGRRGPRRAARGAAVKALGAKMAGHNGYSNIPGYGLYDTTGGTEDWTFWTAGSLGYTFEIGPNGFHPPYKNGVVDEYSAAASRRRGQGRQPRGVLRDAARPEQADAALGDQGHGAGGSR